MLCCKHIFACWLGIHDCNLKTESPPVPLLTCLPRWRHSLFGATATSLLQVAASLLWDRTMHCGTSDMIGLRLMYIGRIQRFEKGINFHSPPSAKTNVKPVEACFLTLTLWDSEWFLWFFGPGSYRQLLAQALRKAPEVQPTPLILTWQWFVVALECFTFKFHVRSCSFHKVPCQILKRTVLLSIDAL